jgi:uncharacterized protein with NAD-binding domain and iron-sulfur cluster
MQRVIVLGGGIGGLSAAHELIERGFAVDVYESLSIAGGKARSIPLAGTGTDGRRDLPGEHGFRFFPRFYRHVIDTMRRIPYGVAGNVADNLVDTSRCQLARFGRHPIDVPARSPRTLGDVRVLLDDFGRFFGGDLGLSHADLTFFASKVWQIVTSCRERRTTEYEKLAWWDFIGAEDRSLAYRKLLGHGITRSLVAAKAREASTKTIGDIFVQLLFDLATPGPSADRVLNGPTNDVWIEPWLKHLMARGLGYHFDAKAVAVAFEDGRIRRATVETPGGRAEVAGDYFVFALPVEDVIDLITPEMVAADPALAHLFTLDDITEWMNGIQIYLREDVPLSRGHTLYVDAPWALTSISQAQFWKDVSLGQFGDGTVRGILSVDISEWTEPGLNGKAAKDCTAEEIKVEVWEQLKRSLNYGDTVILKDDHLCEWGLDPAIRHRPDGRVDNEEPLLVNLVDTWRLRPEAVTKIPNLFLASDYVRTFTDLATMEAANEAARRAVNGILAAAGSLAPPCGIWALHEPEALAPWRELDRIRYERGLPWDDALVQVGLSAQRLAEHVVLALEQGLERHDLFTERGAVLKLAEEQLISLAGHEAGVTPTSALREGAVAFIEGLLRVFAARAADAQSSGRAGSGVSLAAAGPVPGASGPAAGDPRRPAVHIVPQ